MFGWSYLGVTQMSAALAQPPHLISLFPVVTACDFYDEWTYRGGAFQQFFNESWASFRLAPDTLDRRVEKSANAMNRMWNFRSAIFRFSQQVRCATWRPTSFIGWSIRPMTNIGNSGLSMDASAKLRFLAITWGLVRHFPERHAEKLHGRQGPRRNGSGAEWAAADDRAVVSRFEAFGKVRLVT